MTNSNTSLIQDIHEKLGGKIWQKNGISRVYLTEKKLLKIVDEKLWFSPTGNSNHVSNKFYFENGFIFWQRENVGTKNHTPYSYSEYARLGRYNKNGFVSIKDVEFRNELVIDHKNKELFLKLWAEVLAIDIKQGIKTNGELSIYVLDKCNDTFNFINSASAKDVKVCLSEGAWRKYNKVDKKYYYDSKLIISFETEKTRIEEISDLNQYADINICHNKFGFLKQVAHDEAQSIIENLNVDLHETIKFSLENESIVQKTLNITLV